MQSFGWFAFVLAIAVVGGACTGNAGSPPMFGAPDARGAQPPALVGSPPGNSTLGPGGSSAATAGVTANGSSGMAGSAIEPQSGSGGPSAGAGGGDSGSGGASGSGEAGTGGEGESGTGGSGAAGTGGEGEAGTGGSGESGTGGSSEAGTGGSTEAGTGGSGPSLLSDGDACDGGPECESGVCRGGYCCSAACDDGDACTADACASGSGACSHTARDCADTNPCTDDGCNSGSGACTHVNNTASCNDGSACTLNDACSGGTCRGSPRSCDDAEPCTTDTCNPTAAGNPCVHSNNTLACDDGDSCTASDRCLAGSCEPGADACGEGQLACSPGNPNVCSCDDGYTAEPGACVPDGPDVPPPPASCPTLRTGTITVLGQSVELWVGTPRQDRKGSVFFYWHGTGGNSGEAEWGLGPALDEIVADGGIVASFTTTTGTGSNTGNGVWYTGDFSMADQILACAVQQLNIDTRRVYTGGCSAGGLQASMMAYGRSSYLAGAMPNSGGILFNQTPQDPAHIPSVIAAHGAMGTDVVGIDFSVTSNRFTTDIADEGGFAVICDHGGTHCGSPPALIAAQWTFLEAHPWGVDPSPYAAGLPVGFPSYCRIVP